MASDAKPVQKRIQGMSLDGEWAESFEPVRKMVAAEVTRRTVARAGQEIRLVTSAATVPGDFSDTFLGFCWFRLVSDWGSGTNSCGLRTGARIAIKRAVPAMRKFPKAATCKVFLKPSHSTNTSAVKSVPVIAPRTFGT